MGITNLFNIGLQGLKAHRTAMSVTGDNIANMNTVGFKGARVNFRDLLNINGGGSGVEVGSVQHLFTQGAISASQSPLDLAIAGDGFFMVAGPSQGRSGGEFYTRNGQFIADRDGYVVNDQGLRLQAYPFDQAGLRSGTPADLQLPRGVMPPQATSVLSVFANLSSDTPQATGPFDPTSPDENAHAATIQVFDSLGASHNVTVYFTRTATGWQWNAVADGEDLTGGTAGTPTVVGTGNLTFNTDGALDTLVPSPPAFSIDFAGATGAQQISLDFGDAIADGGSGLDGMTQFGSESTTKVVSQDGYPPGELQSLDLTDDGTLLGAYTNGQTRNIAQLALARFASNEGLERSGGNLYSATHDSGQPVIGAPDGVSATVVGYSVEESNVDVATEFVNLIREQRAFSASSRTITTADEVFAETINLKR